MLFFDNFDFEIKTSILKKKIFEPMAIIRAYIWNYYTPERIVLNKHNEWLQKGLDAKMTTRIMTICRDNTSL